jgi:hypothetical protein
MPRLRLKEKRKNERSESALHIETQRLCQCRTLAPTLGGISQLRQLLRKCALCSAYQRNGNDYKRRGGIVQAAKKKQDRRNAGPVWLHRC